MIFFSLLLALVVTWFLVRPHFEPLVQERERYKGELITLLEQKERYVQLLKDLELDFATSKVNLEDYQSMKGALQSDLAQILGSYDIALARDRAGAKA